MPNEMTRQKTTQRKKDERARRRNAGFKLVQVWVHELDMPVFREFMEDLPHEERYSARKTGRPLKMPGM